MDEETLQKLRKFTQDPDWQLVEKMLLDYVEPLKDVMTIDSNLTNDQIASEVRGRQLTIRGLEGFLRGTLVVNKKITSVKPIFR